MSLTPQDIQSQQFHVRFRGFDVDEVDTFLEKVAENFLVLLQENKLLKEQLTTTTAEITAYRQEEKSFQKAIISAQQIAEEMKLQSEQEAASLVDNARQQSEELRVRTQAECDELRAQAHAEIASLEQRLDSLKGKKEALRNELKQTLLTHLEKLDEVFAPQTSEPALSEAAIGKPADAPHLIEDDDNADTLADLYQKIDLSDDLTVPLDARYHEDHPENDGSFSLDDIPAEETLPDLEGDMLFTLDDPLDDLTPEIKIKNHDPS